VVENKNWLGSGRSIEKVSTFRNISAGSASNMTGVESLGSLLRGSVKDGFANEKIPNLTGLGQIGQSAIGADGEWWIIGSGGKVYQKRGSSWTQLMGTTLKQISVNAGQIWGVTGENSIRQWSGTTWQPVAGNLTQVSVGADGSIWGIVPTGKVVRWNGTGWAESVQPPQGSATQISAGDANNVWLVNNEGQVYKLNGTNWDSIKSAGLCKAVAAAADGTVLVIRAADNKVYRKS